MAGQKHKGHYQAPIDYHPMSFADPHARVFWQAGKLYRGIAGKRAGLYRRLFEDGLVRRLSERGLLIETDIADLHCSDYELVLQHRIVPFVSFPHEWCGTMLKAAALLTLALQTELCQAGLSLQDAHPWNVLFDGSEPVFVDFGSIVSASAQGIWPAYGGFLHFFMYPLQLMAHGHERIARWLLHDDEEGVLDEEHDALTPPPLTARMRSLAKAVVPDVLLPLIKRGVVRINSHEPRTPVQMRRERVALLEAARAEIEAIPVGGADDGSAGDDGRGFPPLLPSTDWNAKHHALYGILSETRPRTVLDVGHNRGWYSRLAAKLGATVVAFDVDARCVTQLYQEAKSARERILPLVMDVRNPSPGYGVCYEMFAPAEERFSCEMVMALALVQHLVIKRRLNLQQIAASLSAFSTKWLVVEFVPAEDREMREWWNENRAWYTLEGFRDNLGRYYRTIRVIPSFPEPRVLLFCEK